FLRPWLIDGAPRLRRKENPPARTGARPALVIAAHHDPGRARQQRRGRLEEILLPDFPIVAVRTGLALRRVRALRLAIVIVADMDDEIGIERGPFFRDRVERPAGGAAVLRLRSLDAAAGVADDQNRLRIGAARLELGVADFHGQMARI